MKADCINNLQSAFRLIEPVTPRICGYRVDEDTMYLYCQSDNKSIHCFPFKMKHELAADFVWNWIEQTTPKQQRDKESMKKGFEFSMGNMLEKGELKSIIRIQVIWIEK